MEQHIDCLVKYLTQVTNGDYENSMMAIILNSSSVNGSCMMQHICTTEPLMDFS